jgi:hypothetical protein
MAVFTRTNGDARTVVSVGNVALSEETNGVIISTGIGKPVQAFGVTANATVAAQMGIGEAVETILRATGLNSTLLAYQVDAALVSVLVEQSAWNTTDLQANINAALSAASNNYTVTVTDVGLKLATS